MYIYVRHLFITLYIAIYVTTYYIIYGYYIIIYIIYLTYNIYFHIYYGNHNVYKASLDNSLEILRVSLGITQNMEISYSTIQL